MLPEVKIDKVRQLTFYDYVNKDPGHDPIDIKEYVNNTVWNGLESPGIAHDFPSDGVSELPREGIDRIVGNRFSLRQRHG